MFPFGFGNAPFSFFASRLVDEPEFRRDLKRVALMLPEQFSKLSIALAEHPNFIDKTTFSNIVSSNVPGDSKPVTQLLLRLNRMMRDVAEPIEESLGALRVSLATHPEEFSESEIKVLLDRLLALLVVPKGLARQKKAEMLAEASASELNDITIISDLRPVFDDDQKQIEGALAIATLRLELIEPDGRVNAIECRLNDKQLEDLCKTADSAKRRLVAMRQLLSDKQIPVAKTSDTGGA